MKSLIKNKSNEKKQKQLPAENGINTIDFDHSLQSAVRNRFGLNCSEYPIHWDHYGRPIKLVINMLFLGKMP